MENMGKCLEIAKNLAVEAGNAVMKIYDSEFKVSDKDDKSPLTEADLISNKIIVEGLKKNFPGIIILTEEEADDKKRLGKKYVWIIDPLDGTKEFISKNGEFTINIALVNGGKPVLGVIYIPSKKELYYALEKNGSFFEGKEKKEKISVSDKSEIKNMILVKSRSHATDKLLNLINNNKFAAVITSGSSLKGCLIAKGEADIYYRFGPVNEWDICAMNAIINEAGGIVTDLKGKILKYNKEDTLIQGFIASNNKIHSNLVKLGE